MKFGGTEYESVLDLVFPSVLGSDFFGAQELVSGSPNQSKPAGGEQLSSSFCVAVIAGGVDLSRLSSCTARAYSDSTGACSSLLRSNPCS